MISRCAMVLSLLTISCAEQDTGIETEQSFAAHMRAALSEHASLKQNDASAAAGSLHYLRGHSTAALRYLEPVLMADEAPARWEMTWLVGQFGGADALEMLRQMALREPPKKAVPDASDPTTEHEMHDVHGPGEEELLTRLQAVASIGQIATREATLRQTAIDDLMEIARSRPGLRGMVLHQMRALMEEDDYLALGALFEESDSYYFKRLPTPDELRARVMEGESQLVRGNGE